VTNLKTSLDVAAGNLVSKEKEVTNLKASLDVADGNLVSKGEEVTNLKTSLDVAAGNLVSKEKEVKKQFSPVCFVFSKSTLTMNFARPITIATHSGIPPVLSPPGSFHADEALAVYMLKQLFTSTVTLVRTRDPEAIDKADIVVDVGSVYDPARHRYDHHQREFTETFSPRHTVTRLSSAGLVYKHFGQQVVAKFLPGLSVEKREIVYQKVCDVLVLILLRYTWTSSRAWMRSITACLNTPLGRKRYTRTARICLVEFHA
jgi:hypothetical protein